MRNGLHAVKRGDRRCLNSSQISRMLSVMKGAHLYFSSKGLPVSYFEILLLGIPVISATSACL